MQLENAIHRSRRNALAPVPPFHARKHRAEGQSSSKNHESRQNRKSVHILTVSGACLKRT